MNRARWASSALPFIAALAALGLALWLALAWQYRELSRSVEAGLVSETLAEAQVLAALLPRTSDPRAWGEPPFPASRRITVIAADGSVLFDSVAEPARMENHDARPEVAEARRSGQGTASRVSASTGSPFIYAAAALPDGRVVRVAAPFAVETALVRSIFASAAAAAVIVATVAGVLVGYAAWRDRARFRELQHVSRAFAAGDYRRRVHLPGGGTAGLIAGELNQLGERLQRTLTELDTNRQLLDTALGSLQEGVACIDRLDRVVYANAAFRQIAAGGAEVIGQLFYEHLPAAALQEPLALARTGGGAGAQACALEHRRRQLEAVVTSAGDEIAVLVLHDATEVRLAEQSRRDFMSSVSHEFKTPLTSIQGFAETLLDGAIDDPSVARDFVAKITRHAERLSSLVHDVLTLARLEQGGWSVRAEDVTLAPLLRALADEYQPAAQSRHVAITLACPDALALRSDPELLRQLVGNLLSNAVRYNREHGSVTITAAEDGEQIRIVVQDTGPGIPREHHERIFERFYRVDAHRSRQTGGTGLGLAIVRQLLALLKGSVRLRSDAGGTSFEVSIPRRLG